MKKIILISLAALLALTLAACHLDIGGLVSNIAGDISDSFDGILSRDDGSSSDSGASQNESETDVSGFDINSILSGNGETGTVWGNMDEDTKNKIREKAREAGAEVTFREDGGMDIKKQDGSELHQNPDGTWTYTDENGTQAQFGGNWPENEFTKQVPKPDFQLSAASTDSDSFTASFSQPDMDLVRAYAKKLQDAGFDQDIDVRDQEVAGMAIYAFEASNGKGYSVSIACTAGICAFSIKKD